MSQALRFRLLGIGKMPSELKRAGDAPGVLVAQEGISVRESVRSLRIPRASVGHASKLLVGSLVVKRDRLLASIGTYLILDTDLPGTGQDGSELTLGEDGLRITFDVAGVLPDGVGSVEVRYRVPLAPEMLAQLPSISHPAPLTNAFPALLRGWQGTRAR